MDIRLIKFAVLYITLNHLQYINIFNKNKIPDSVISLTYRAS